MSNPPRDEIVARLEPAVAEAVAAVGFDLEELDIQLAGRRRLVKVVIDADAGVGLDDITTVSRELSKLLDEHEHVLAGSYNLEVTSPGVDRPLTKPRHWKRALHRLVRIRLADGGDLLARAGAAEDGSVVVLAAGEIRRLTYREIEHAVVEVEFQQPPAQDLVKLDRAAGVVASRGDDGENTEESR
ncbi:ribosome maturation factor RimP [Saccharopolyspora lacisalsi]|uniref:Ribosome maturation factor RimP n=1 Tax=Halosaccharopolyspora lacisalsi TaxID=1000566 RepID=A0A839DQK7_9PSEU|nr:ribosome maturation factor RimP [Halosaccharopolyspora lacisalsi]MBA8823353.1 ribosome maturation factor RimP [Halosaccharopolyspora lacisalsi]